MSRASAGTALVVTLLTACTPGAQDADGDTAPERTSRSGSSSSPSPTLTPTPTPTPTSTLTPTTAPTPELERRAAVATVTRVGPSQWRLMVDAGMVRPECPIQRPGQLRRVVVHHHGFDGRVHRGEVVVNADVAASVARIFTRIFRSGFPIRSILPMERFDGDNTASLRADNTAAFNCRQPEQNNAPYRESPHANGRAIDINPRENPWRDLRCDCWSPGPRQAARTPGRGKILRGGPVWRAFRAEGWIWQDIDVPDYMHFDTGYPSRRFDAGG